MEAGGEIKIYDKGVEMSGDVYKLLDEFISQATSVGAQSPAASGGVKSLRLLLRY